MLLHAAEQRAFQTDMQHLPSHDCAKNSSRAAHCKALVLVPVSRHCPLHETHRHSWGQTSQEARSDPISRRRNGRDNIAVDSGRLVGLLR